MSEQESFIARWWRRKTEAARVAPARPERSAPSETGSQPSPPPASPASAADKPAEHAAEPAVELTHLPPIESITSETDIRAFLAPGVPPELARAALRRAWSADPAIRDYVGPSENAWDFTAPDAVAGFGSLPLSEETQRQVREMVGRSLAGRGDQEGEKAQIHEQGADSASASQTAADSSGGPAGKTREPHTDATEEPPDPATQHGDREQRSRRVDS